MKRTGMIFVLLAFGVLATRAQERKIEIAPFAGGYFSAGFRSATIVQLGAPGTREFKPVDEPNSGIFGVRGSYDLTRRFTAEGTFGFSPAGREFARVPIAIGILAPSPPTNVTQAQQAAIAVLAPVIRGKDTFQYSGNVLINWRKAKGWTPFVTAGVGAVTRTAEVRAVSGVPVPILGGVPFRPTIVVPSPTSTDWSVNIGGGVKKYFSSRCGIRSDFRDYISPVSEDIVNNLEVSLGLILRM